MSLTLYNMAAHSSKHSLVLEYFNPSPRLPPSLYTSVSVICDAYLLQLNPQSSTSNPDPVVDTNQVDKQHRTKLTARENQVHWPSSNGW